ncbi:VOC family protein [Paracoccus sp. p4-l81]|uniref:VOC family protein n=1 Tax=Paracoccus sp. p4-l81 TaxID=3342806 RepID=UPI0035B76103
MALRVVDLEASRAFYRAVLGALGHGEALQGDSHQFWLDELYVDASPGPVSRVHLAFQAATRAQVDAFHAAGLAAGGRDNGAPGLRPYHDCYYAAFLLDPDGNNIEAVCDAPTRRSAPVIEVERLTN